MNLPSVERLVRRTANRFGVDIHRYRPEDSACGQLARMLGSHRADLVLDVGANVGQFGRGIREGGYRGRMVSFEPLSEAHNRLVRAARADPEWEVAPRMAIGDRDGEIEMKVSLNSYSSSALTVLPRHTAAAPDSVCVAVERATVMRLEKAADGFLQPGCRPFVKIDTQGYEDRVLDGAASLMERIVGLQLELSFVPLYQDQVLFDGMVERLTSAGFRLWALWPGFREPQTGRMLQVDAAFFRGRSADE